MAPGEDQTAREADSRKRKRTRSGCLNCRRKKRKCDETRPTCQRCSRVGATCEWGVRVSFRPMNGFSSPPRPTTVDPSVAQPAQFSILDVTDSVKREYHHDAGGDLASMRRHERRSIARSPEFAHHFVPPTPGGHGDELVASPHVPHAMLGKFHPRTGTDHGAESPQGGPASVMVHRGRDLSAIPHPSPALSDATFAPEKLSPRNHYSDTTTPLSQQTEHAASQLLSLSQTSPFLPSPRVDHASPEIIRRPILPDTPLPELADSSEDGLFRPGSAYLDLHSTLRHYIFQESRSTSSTRCPTPCIESDGETADSAYEDTAEAEEGTGEPGFVLTKEQEGILWVNWLEEVAPGLDKFDHDHHFQRTLSLMAKTNPHLKYSIMAVSARQMERKGTRDSYRPISLALYQRAIHLLLPQLTTRSTPVIASCVVLCVLEMLSCSPKAWQRHLDGCATLLQAVGINGFSGGVEQALFWCFSRMDVCGGIISSGKTLVPVSAWTPEGELHAAINLFRRSGDFGTYANQAVFLMAQVVDLIATVGFDTAGSTFSHSPPSREDFAERWRSLWGFVDNWYQLRPGEMQPVFTSDAPNAIFPTILFSNPAAISGNQMYHTTAVLMLQHRPPGVVIGSKPRSVLWHARRIVAISRSNGHHGCWTNSLQPLWIAGKIFKSPEEQGIIVDILDRIERESGWATRWRIADLREWWGASGSNLEMNPGLSGE